VKRSFKAFGGYMKAAIWIGIKDGFIERVLCEDDNEEKARRLADLEGLFPMKVSLSDYNLIKSVFEG